MSTGQIVGGVLGAAASFIPGLNIGVFLGAQLGMTLGGMVDPVRPKGTTTEGPRLDDLSVQTATYGAALPRTYGKVPVEGNIFWLENNQIKQDVTITRSGGGGGKGGRKKKSKNKTITYTYSATFAVGLCEADDESKLDLVRIWIREQLWYDAYATDPATVAASTAAAEYFTFYDGRDTQGPNARMQATLGVDNTPAFRGVCYLVFEDLPLARYGNSLQGAMVRAEVQYNDDSTTTVSLGTIVRRECLRSGVLTTGDIDVSALTQAVRGYRITSPGSLRSALEPLRAAYPFDVIQHGYQLLFKPRGGGSVKQIAAEDYAAHPATGDVGPRMNVAMEVNGVLPRCVNLRFLDVNRDYNLGVAIEERSGSEDSNELTLDLPLVLDASQAAGIAQVLLRAAWVARSEWSFAVSGDGQDPDELGEGYGMLEVGDVVTLQVWTGLQDVRLTHINYTSDNRLECRAVTEHPSVYIAAAVPAQVLVYSDPVLLVAGASVYLLLDVPLMAEGQSAPGILACMWGASDGWPGGGLLQSVDGGGSWLGIADFVPPEPTIGVASNVIGAVETRLVDSSSVLAVTLTKGAIYSVTEAQMLGGRNRFAYGVHGRWEIISARTVTALSAMDYTLQDCLRGQFGTEWAMSLHQVGDQLVLLEDAAVESIAMESAGIGLARQYRGITDEAAIDSDTSFSWTYAGVNLKPLAPAYLNGNRDAGSNDWSLSWVRRTRLGGEWRDGVDAALGEESEKYEVEIFSSSAFASVKRTLSGSAPSVTYSSGDQVSDFGSNQATLYIKVYQMSVTVGRGYPLISTITR